MMKKKENPFQRQAKGWRQAPSDLTFSDIAKVFNPSNPLTPPAKLVVGPCAPGGHLDDFAYDPESLALTKWARSEKRPDIERLPSTDEVGILHLRSEDLWIRGLWILGEAAVAWGFMEIANYVKRRLGNDLDNSSVSLEVTVQEGDRATRISYSGPAKDFVLAVESETFREEIVDADPDDPAFQ